MIRVVYAPGCFRLTVEGHANSGGYGQDLICAAASALAVTLAETVAALEEKGRVKEARARLEPGRAEISCRPRLGKRGAVRAVFDTAARGYARLAREYPEYLTLEAGERRGRAAAPAGHRNRDSGINWRLL